MLYDFSRHLRTFTVDGKVYSQILYPDHDESAEKAKALEVVNKKFLCSCLSRLVCGGTYFSGSGDVVDNDQNIFIAPLAPLERYCIN